MKHILAATAELASLLHRWQMAPTKELTVELLRTLEQAGVVPMTMPEGVEMQVPPPQQFLSGSTGCSAEVLPVPPRPLHCDIDMFGINTGLFWGGSDDEN